MFCYELDTNNSRPFAIVSSARSFDALIIIPDYYCPCPLVLLLPPFPNCVCVSNQLLISKTAFPMVVEDAAGLQMGINCNGTHVFQPPLFQLDANPVRQAVFCWNDPFLVAHVEIGLPLGEAPDEVAERTKLLPYFLKALGIADDRFDLPLGADHALGIHNTFNVRLIVGRYFDQNQSCQNSPGKSHVFGASCSSSGHTAWPPSSGIQIASDRREHSHYVKCFVFALGFLR